MNTSWAVFLNRPSVHLSVLLVIGYQAFFSNISLSFFAEAEGLYAMVTHTMMATQDYVHLSLLGKPYFNKPPLFFWLQAEMIHELGWSETAHRLPSAIASVGIMLTTYWFGWLLFSPLAGFWAALVVATCYGGLWFGPLAIIDPVMTFCMTLGLYGWARAYFLGSSQHWYVVGFAALAVGAMVKTLHAFALPAVTFAIFLWMRRDGRIFREWWFRIGFGVFGLMLSVYYVFLGQEFWQHFFFEENLNRLVTVAGDTKNSAWEAYWGKRPIQWYGYTIWFDVFPWSVMIPIGFLLLWYQRSWRTTPQELLVFLWVVVYFLALSLVPEKHERYLLPLLPGVGLVVGYIYYTIFQRGPLPVGRGLLRALLGLVGITYVVGVFLGPILLQKKWYVPLDILPIGLRIGLGILGISLLGLAVMNRVRVGLMGVGVMGLALMLTVTGFIIPGIHNKGSPRFILHENQRWLAGQKDPILVFQSWGWRSDEDQFYWNYLHGNARIVGENLVDNLAMEELKGEVQRTNSLVIMMTEGQYHLLISPDQELEATILLEFHRSKKKIYLLSLRWRSPTA